MTLVDTSVWVQFFRGADRARHLSSLLEDDEVLLHPWVLGELLLGGIGRHRRARSDLQLLPQAPVVSEAEVFALVESRPLHGQGLGWVDAQLFASALVSGSSLWTFDRKLARVVAG